MISKKDIVRVVLMVIMALMLIAGVVYLIATGKEFAFGTVLYIDGIGERTVEDRGVKDGCIDVLCDCHANCYALTGYYDVYILEGNK